MDKRGDMVAACRQAAQDDGVQLGNYDHVIAFVHAPPSNAGADSVGGNAVFDQGGSIPFFQHELGHVLGFEHAFGPTCGDFLSGYAYHDDYCVMGFTGPQSHPLSTPLAYTKVTILGGGFWQSERRPAAASLYRWMEDALKSETGFLRTDLSMPVVMRLVALSEARLHDPILVIAKTKLGDILIEYRVATGDDAGVAAAVVVHSLGRRRTMENESEDRPAWFEATVPAVNGKVASAAGDLRVKIVTVHPNNRIAIEIDRPPAD
jgi:hypothetical protein